MQVGCLFSSYNLSALENSEKNHVNVQIRMQSCSEAGILQETLKNSPKPADSFCHAAFRCLVWPSAKNTSEQDVVTMALVTAFIDVQVWYGMVWYSGIYITPLNSCGPPEALLVWLVALHTTLHSTMFSMSRAKEVLFSLKLYVYTVQVTFVTGW